MKALIIDRVSPLVESGLKEYGVEVDVKILPSREELKALVPNYDVLVMRVDPKMDKEMLDAVAIHTKMICVCSAGTNHIDMEYAKKLGIRVQNAPGLNSNAVAELTISKMLDLSRMTVEANEEVQKEGIWNKYKYTGHELKGHTLGIIGYGKIGKRVGHLAQAFGMTTIAYDPYITKESCTELGTEQVADLDELIRRSDYITVHTPITPETRGMISFDQFKKMKDGVIVLNMARGGMLDEDAAYEALRSGKVRGIGVDVMASELAGGTMKGESTVNSPLFQFDNFIVSPHIGGGGTIDGLDILGDCVIGHICDIFGLTR